MMKNLQKCLLLKIINNNSNNNSIISNSNIKLELTFNNNNYFKMRLLDIYHK
jgi:hypothetical protein